MRHMWREVQGDGPPLILMHPVGLDAEFWGNLPDILSSSYTVARADLVGHGRSSDASRPGRLSDYVADIVSLIGELGGGPAILLGVSFGGMLAQNIVLSRPDLVRALVLAGCPGAIPAAARPAMLLRGADAEAEGMAAVVGVTMQRWFTHSFLSTEEARHVRHRLLENTPSNWAATWEAIAEHDALSGLGRLDIPALVIAGADDEATSLDAKRALAAAIPGSRLEVLSGAPHIMQIECEARFTELVTGFLATLEGARA